MGSVKSEKLFRNVNVGEHSVLFSTLEWKNPFNTTSATDNPIVQYRYLYHTFLTIFLKVVSMPLKISKLM